MPRPASCNPRFVRRASAVGRLAAVSRLERLGVVGTAGPAQVLAVGRQAIPGVERAALADDRPHRVGLALAFALTLTFQPVSAADSGGRARNVILMVADGAGHNTWTATSMYQGTLGEEFYDSGDWVRLAASTHPLRRAMEVYDAASREAEPEKQRAIFREALQIAADNVWTMSPSTPPPTLVICKKGFRNVPKTAVYSWDFQSPGNTGVETSGSLVHGGGRRLEDPHRREELRREAHPGDREVLDGPHGLRAEEGVGRHVDGAQRVGFLARGGHGETPLSFAARRL